MLATGAPLQARGELFYGSRILVLDDVHFAYSLELAKRNQVVAPSSKTSSSVPLRQRRQLIVATTLESDDTLLHSNPFGLANLLELRRDHQDIVRPMFEVNAGYGGGLLPVEELAAYQFTDIVFIYAPAQGGNSKKLLRKHLQQIFRGVGKLVEEGGAKFHLVWMPSKPTIKRVLCGDASHLQREEAIVYWGCDPTELGPDVEELLLMGAEQAMRVNRVSAFKLEQFPALHKCLKGYKRGSKGLSWETFTFEKAYTLGGREEEKIEEAPSLLLSEAKKLERCELFQHHCYDQIGTSSGQFHLYRPRFTQDIAVLFDDFVYDDSSAVRKAEPVLFQMIQQIAGGLVVAIQPLIDKGNSQTPAEGRLEKEGNAASGGEGNSFSPFIRNYRLHWQGVAVPLSQEIAADFMEGLRYELTLTFTRRTSDLVGCKLLGPPTKPKWRRSYATNTPEMGRRTPGNHQERDSSKAAHLGLNSTSAEPHSEEVPSLKYTALS